MALSGGDRARLGRIEAELTRADPGLAARFRRWRPAARNGSTPTGWSAVPAWMAVVFLVGFCTWALAPFVGWLVAVVGATWGLWEWLAARKRTTRRSDSGWWFRPIDRW